MLGLGLSSVEVGLGKRRGGIRGKIIKKKEEDRGKGKGKKNTN